jgi:hypothetical protein
VCERERERERGYDKREDMIRDKYDRDRRYDKVRK